MIETAKIESGKPLAVQGSSRVHVQLVDTGEFRANLVASAGIRLEKIPLAPSSPAAAVAKAETAAAVAVPQPLAERAAATLTAGSSGAALPAPAPAVTAASPPKVPVALPHVESAVEDQPKHIATAGQVATPPKKAAAKPVDDSDETAPTVVVASAPIPAVVVAPVPAEASQAAIAPEAEVPVEAAPQEATLKGAKPVVGAAREPRKAVEPKVAPANAAAAPVAAADPLSVLAPVAAVGHPAAAPAPTAPHAASAVAAIGASTSRAFASESSIASAKLTPASGPSVGDLQTLVATPNVLEVGVATGTHGWLRVRAEMGQMGEVTASMVATSAGAAEGLHKELPAISAYLAGERVGVSSLVVNAADKGAAAQDATARTGSGDAGGNQPGTRPGTQPGTEQGSGQREQAGRPQAGGAISLDLPGLDLGPVAMNLPIGIPVNGSGSWLSVRV